MASEIQYDFPRWTRQICRRCLKYTDPGVQKYSSCSGCPSQERYYCSKSCQKRDWVSHRFFCEGNSNKIHGYTLSSDLHLVNVDNWTRLDDVRHHARRCYFVDSRFDFPDATAMLFQRYRRQRTLQVYDVDEAARMLAVHEGGPRGRRNGVPAPLPADMTTMLDRARARSAGRAARRAARGLSRARSEP